jgi:hypothetical protein
VPIQYERSDARRRALIMITGAFDVTEVLECLERHRLEGGWTFGLLYDLRLMVGQPSIEDLRLFSRTMTPRPGEPQRGPVAILATDREMYARACAYTGLVQAPARVEVFRARDEAEAWLDANG